jgi:hypothetical protein
MNSASVGLTSGNTDPPQRSTVRSIYGTGIAGGGGTAMRGDGYRARQPRSKWRRTRRRPGENDAFGNHTCVVILETRTDEQGLNNPVTWPNDDDSVRRLSHASGSVGADDVHAGAPGAPHRKQARTGGLHTLTETLLADLVDPPRTTVQGGTLSRAAGKLRWATPERTHYCRRRLLVYWRRTDSPWNRSYTSRHEGLFGSDASEWKPSRCCPARQSRTMDEASPSKSGTGQSLFSR